MSPLVIGIDFNGACASVSGFGAWLHIALSCKGVLTADSLAQVDMSGFSALGAQVPSISTHYSPKPEIPCPNTLRPTSP